MRNDLHPGWKMTRAQHGSYWRLVGEVCAAVGATTAAQREDTRQQIHLRAFGCEKSAREINKLRDFDDFKAAALAILQPTNLAGQMRQAEMPRTRLIHKCREIAPEAYIIAVARKKFHVEDWERLDESDLTMLRNTLCARAAAGRWSSAVRDGEPETALFV